MEDIVTALRLFREDSNLVNIDLIDETVYINGRKYLRFLLDNTIYEFQVLLFDLSSAPYVFTKLIKPILAQLRIRGLLPVNYLDDFVCIENSADNYFYILRVSRLYYRCEKE